MAIGPGQFEMGVPPDATANEADRAEEHQLQTQGTWRDASLEREDHPLVCSTPVAAERVIPVDEVCPEEMILPIIDDAVAGFDGLILCSPWLHAPQSLLFFLSSIGCGRNVATWALHA